MHFKNKNKVKNNGGHSMLALSQCTFIHYDIIIIIACPYIATLKDSLISTNFHFTYAFFGFSTTH